MYRLTAGDYVWRLRAPHILSQQIIPSLRRAFVGMQFPQLLLEVLRAEAGQQHARQQPDQHNVNRVVDDEPDDVTQGGSERQSQAELPPPEADEVRDDRLHAKHVDPE